MLQLTIRSTRRIVDTKRKKEKYNYLVELVRDDNTEAESEPERSVEKEEQFPPSLAWIGSQP